MTNQKVLSDSTSIRGLVVGVLGGALLGIATSLVFLFIVIGPLLGLGIAIAGMRAGIRGQSSATRGGGLLIGMGSVYLYGALNTLDSCQGQEVCGGASTLPFLGLALVVLALGILIATISVARRP